jgi:thioredoxin-dependent peroxiredoxin
MQGFFGSEPLAVGSVAPDFSLPDQSGRAVSLRDFKGKNNVVLVFYPADATPG